MRLPLLTCVLALVSLSASAQEVDVLTKSPIGEHATSELVKPSRDLVVETRPIDVLLRAKTVCVETKTDFFTPETLERKLMGDPDFPKLGLVIVKDKRVADLVIQIDRPLFTHQRTYTVFDPKTTIVLLTGNVRAFDGTLASGPIAQQIVKALLKQEADATAAKSPPPIK